MSDRLCSGPWGTYGRGVGGRKGIVGTVRRSLRDERQNHVALRRGETFKWRVARLFVFGHFDHSSNGIVRRITRLIRAQRCCELLPTATVTRDSTLAARVSGFLARPLVGGTFLMGGLAPFARNLSLLSAIHRRKPAIFLGHVVLLPSPGSVPRRTSTRSC